MAVVTDHEDIEELSDIGALGMGAPAYAAATTRVLGPVCRRRTRVYRLRIQAHRRRIQVYRRQIRVYWRRIRVYRRRIRVGCGGVQAPSRAPSRVSKP